MVFRGIAAFIKKDLLVQISYRLEFMLNWVNILLQAGTFFFVAKLVGAVPASHIKEYGGEYFSFVLLGLALTGYFFNALRSFEMHLREEQMLGTLESIMLTPMRLTVLIIALPCWDFIFSLVYLFIYGAIGVGFLGAKFVACDVPAVAAILILSVISLCSIGICSAAFIMIFKRGSPITWGVAGLSAFFGGAYFPVTMLPLKLQAISYMLPVTYSLRSLRHALLQGYSFKMLAPDIAVLAACCVVLFPASIMVFKFAVRKAKTAGTLGQY
jgi:ABC-2 type transport system permease protein